jgi:Flp pilus assembly CpaE family ATPase
MFPYVVVDLNNAFSGEQVEALWHSDVILMVLRLDYIAVRNARRAMDNLKATGISLDRVELVANRCRQPKQLPIRQAEEALGKSIRHRIPDDPRRVHRAINKGTLVALKQPLAPISKRMKELAVDVNGFCPAT